MESILTLLKLLFTDPKQAMYQAREEENKTATLILGAIGVCLPALIFIVTPLGLTFGIAFGLSHFILYVLSIFLAGNFTGGSGSFSDILQICGLIWLPVCLVGVITNVMGVGLVGSIFSWVVLYYAVLVGHSFSTFNDVKLTLVVAVVFNFVGGMMVTSFLKKLAAAMF